MSVRYPISMLILFALAMPALAERPDLEPGMWQTTSTVSFEGEMDIPDETETETECLTEEDLSEAEFFMDDDECTVEDRELSSSGLSGRMICDYGGEASAELDIEMHFSGDRMDGRISGVLSTPMGELQMLSEMEGERIGDC